MEGELSLQCNKVEVRKNRFLNVLHTTHRDSKVALFFVHGVGGRIGHWRHQITYFRQFYDIIAYDHFGFGGSDKDMEHGEIYHPTEYVKDFDIIFDLYKKESNILIGHSMGSSKNVFRHPRRSID
jgi:pimeloyl-ACP methyl ester carboxylesterase